MNLPALAPQWITILFLAVLTLAAVEDALRLRISNILTAAVLLLGVAGIVLGGPRIELWENLLVFFLVLGLGTLLFSAGKLGGGDVKLFAAAALWFDLGGAPRFIAAVTLAGGVLVVLIVTARVLSGRKVTTPDVSSARPKKGIPYGVAIAAGAAIAVSIGQAPTRPSDPLQADIPRLNAR